MHALLDLLFPPRTDEQLLRMLSRAAFLARARPQLAAGTRPPAAALYLYGDEAARAAIHEAKYHGSAHAFDLLAGALADFLPAHLADRLGGAPARVCIVPIPLGKARRRERGYNQVEEVARRALRLMADPALALDPALLTRVRETPTQVSLARKAREANMRGAFGTLGTPDPSRLYVVLDDVLTTGATLGAALDALAAAGAPRENLLPVALAYQP